MQWVRNVAGFLAVNLFFVAIGTIAAGVIWALGTAMISTWPDARDEGWPWIIVGAAGVAVALWIAFKFIRVISRLPHRG